MFFSHALFTIVATTAVLVAAIPVPAPAPVAELTHALAKRGKSISFFEHPFFAGAKVTMTPGDEQACTTLPLEWNNKVSSMVLQEECTFFNDDNCPNNQRALRLGAGEYGQMPAGFDESISSFTCIQHVTARVARSLPTGRST